MGIQILFEHEEARVVLFHPDSNRAVLATLFESVVLEQGWLPGHDLCSYPNSSICFGLEVNQRLAGGLQLVVGHTLNDLPCHTVWPELEWQEDSAVADIALLALRKEYRGQRRLFWLLCIEMWRYCCQNGITTLWTEVTPANLRTYRRLGWPLQIQGPLRSHWGEECYPCSMTIEDVGQSIAEKARTHPSYRTLLAQAHRGEGSQSSVLLSSENTLAPPQPTWQVLEEVEA